jgi:hypothetical protein
MTARGREGSEGAIVGFAKRGDLHIAHQVLGDVSGDGGLT